MKKFMAFNTLAFANQLKSAGVPSDIAEVHATANAQMLEDLVQSSLATKNDLEQVKFELKQDIKDLENRLTLRLGAIIASIFGIFTALTSVLHLIH